LHFILKIDSEKEKNIKEMQKGLTILH